jgi:hypothetical protein
VSRKDEREAELVVMLSEVVTEDGHAKSNHPYNFSEGVGIHRRLKMTS